MKFFDHLFSVTQRAHALASHFSLLCEQDMGPDGLLHPASLRDFLGSLRITRQEIEQALEALEQETTRALALVDNEPLSPDRCTYRQLCDLLRIFDPYLDTYPALSAAEALKLYADNTLDHYYPLAKGTPQGPA